MLSTTAGLGRVVWVAWAVIRPPLYRQQAKRTLWTSWSGDVLMKILGLEYSTATFRNISTKTSDLWSSSEVYLISTKTSDSVQQPSETYPARLGSSKSLIWIISLKLGDKMANHETWDKDIMIECDRSRMKTKWGLIIKIDVELFSHSLTRSCGGAVL